MIVGIDLGTTNSLVGFWQDGQPVLVPNALGHFLTPSAVGLGDDGAILVGLAARERLVSHPGRTAAVFKRYMGTDRLMFLGEKGYRAEELAALVLRSLKADAEAFLGLAVEEAVITVPAYFNDAQRKATKAAGELAGLRVPRLLTEPTAAALAYGLETPGEENLLLVVDLGGGTFDVSLLQCFEGVTEVRAVAGDSWLGGEDFVDVIVAAFMDGPGRVAGLPPATAPSVVQGALRRQAELAKRRLTEAESATLEIVHDGKPISWTLDRAHFEAISEPVLARLRAPIERALRDARVDPDALSRIILAGGASRMPAFRRLIARLFRRLPAQHINPDEVVARGAAVSAGMAMRHTDLRETVLTDVAPFTLGIEVMSDFGGGERYVDGLYLPIIERNTVIPASRTRTVVTVQDNQRELAVMVYQGESRFVGDNVLLGQLAVPVPKGPKGREAVDVRFSYDTSGLLEVEAVVKSNGRRASLVIEGNPGILSRAEIEERLLAMARLKVHPRDDSRNRAVVTRAERLYEERLGDVRRLVGDGLARFLAALEGQDQDEITEVREALGALLDEIDDDFFL